MIRTRQVFAAALILACAVLMLAGCNKRVPVQNQVTPIPILENVSDKEIESAIIRAGAVTGWNIVPSGERTLIGTLNLRGHQAVVVITYDKKNYRITYKSSLNLKYDGATIHRNYNNWVIRLDDNIRRHIAELSRK